MKRLISLIIISLFIAVIGISVVRTVAPVARSVAQVGLTLPAARHPSGDRGAAASLAIG